MSKRDRLGRKCPSRRDLLLIIGELQGIIGQIQAVDNDRNPNRKDDKDPLFTKGHQLCVDARSFDPPIEGGSKAGWPWGNPKWLAQELMRMMK